MILPTLNVCARDAHLAALALEVCAHLDGQLDADLLLVHPDTFDITPIATLARTAFTRIHVEAYADWQGDTTWPKPQNWAWQRVAKLVSAQIGANSRHAGWLWWEADALPIRKGWLTTLSDAFRARPRVQFAGVKCDTFSHTSYMNGVGIYPFAIVDALANTPALYDMQQPFDIAAGPVVMQSFKSMEPLMQHHIKHQGGGCGVSFRDLPAEAVFVHGCTDGSLHELILGITRAKSDTCVVCLGRYGDILNALPIAQRLAKKSPVPFLAAREFIDILDGISYVKPILWNGAYSNMTDACAWAATRFKKVVRAQIFGTPEAAKNTSIPHNIQAWNLAGYKWHSDWPLTIDRRDKERERALISKHITPNPKPVLLTMLTGGHSGPYSGGAKLQARLQSDFASSCQIVDLAGIKAERIYDLLGLYEVAAALVTIDSATHHLAAAHPNLPCAVFLPDDPYMAAQPRCNVGFTAVYSKVEQHYNELKAWITRAIATPAFHHVYEHHNYNARELRMQSTWPALHQGMGWRNLPFKEPYPRSSRSLGDLRGVPYVNDLLAHALTHTQPNDIVVLTNSDIALLPEVQTDILTQLSIFPATCSSRRDIATFANLAKSQPAAQHIHWGRDLFAFRAWWLARFLPELPPLLLGSNEWDNVILNLIRREAGALIPGQWDDRHAYTITVNEMASPNVLHEAHVPYADKPENKHGPHNQWNHIQLVEWSHKHCPGLVFPYAELTYEQYKRNQISFKP